MVSIESADYLALGTDQIENDILTEFTLSLPNGYWVYGWTYIYCEIELPSGGYYYTELLVLASYSRLSLTLAWHNTATEIGWYTFFVYANILGQNVLRPGTDSLMFDPPTDGDAGPPLLEIIQVVAN